MGRLKDSLIDPETIAPHPDRFVSPECFEDAALQDLVAANLVSKICTYTGRKSRKPIAAPLDVVLEHIFASLERHFDDAANGVAWDEGEYVGNLTRDTWDLVDEEIAFGEESGNLYANIVNALPQRDWTKIDPYGPRRRDVLSWSWDDFTATVKHVRRFFFQRLLKPADWREEKVSSAALLHELLSSCEDAGLVKALAAAQRYYRCRPRRKGERFTKPADLGPPPNDRASQSRMSPAGISMFYGARDKETAQAETLMDGQRYAMAEFRTTRPIRVLDLSQRPRVGIFDLHHGHLNEWAHFMAGFITDFQRPVAHDGAQHIDYVPTQIVTEFIRSWTSRDGRIDGVAYSSVKKQGGGCVVLFADGSEVEEAIDPSVSPTGS